MMNWKRHSLDETLTAEGADTILQATNEHTDDLRKHDVVAIHLWDDAVFIYEYPNQEFWTLDGSAECLGTRDECIEFLKLTQGDFADE